MIFGAVYFYLGAGFYLALDSILGADLCALAQTPLMSARCSAQKMNRQDNAHFYEHGVVRREGPDLTNVC